VLKEKSKTEYFFLSYKKIIQRKKKGNKTKRKKEIQQ